MIYLKTPAEIEAMRKAGAIVAEIHKSLRSYIAPGVSTLEINDFVARMITKLGAKQVTKGYGTYNFETCASVNDVIAHGFPNKKPLEEGDIVTIDIVVNYEGWMGDSGWTYAIGKVSEEAERLMRVTKECLYLGIDQAVAGNRLGDIGHAIQSHAESHGFSSVRDLCAHGIGRALHEEPQILHVGSPGKGLRIKEGMVFTIEPMINAGEFWMTVDEDGWTARTADGSLSAQYEHTIAITADGPVILTDQDI